MHVWNFAPVWANADLLALGLLNTLKVTDAALAVAPAALAVERGDRSLPHHPAAGPAVLVLLRAADPDQGRDDALRRRRAHVLDPVGGVLRRGVPRRHRLGRAGPVGSGARARHGAAAGDAPRRPAAGRQADGPGLPRARDRADEDDDARRHRLVR